MYNISFTYGTSTITKTAHDEKEVRRLVYLYSRGSQSEKEGQITEILGQAELEDLKKTLKKNKIDNEIN